MNPSEQEIIVQANPLRELAYQLCIKVDIPEEHARLIADLQVETDLRGVHSHGTRALPGYLKSVLHGDLEADPQIRVVEEGPGYAVIDGGNGLGHPPCAMAMEMAIEKDAASRQERMVFIHHGWDFGGDEVKKGERVKAEGEDTGE